VGAVHAERLGENVCVMLSSDWSMVHVVYVGAVVRWVPSRALKNASPECGAWECGACVMIRM